MFHGNHESLCERLGNDVGRVFFLQKILFGSSSVDFSEMMLTDPYNAPKSRLGGSEKLSSMGDKIMEFNKWNSVE